MTREASSRLDPSADQPVDNEAPRFEHALSFSVAGARGNAVGRMQVDAGMLNPFGTVHAGALVWFADVVATRAALGAQELQDGGNGFPLAVTLSAQLLRNRKSGELIATASTVRQGRRISVIRTEVRDESGILLLDLTSTHTPAS